MLKRRTYLIIILGLLILLIHSSCQESNPKEAYLSISPKEAIDDLLKSYRNKDDSLRYTYLEHAKELAEKHQLDSLWFVVTHKLTNYQYRNGDYYTFKQVSRDFLHKALTLNDSVYIGKGNYKLGSYYFKTFVYDSAYYHFNEAQHTHKKLADSLNIAINLLNMAIIQIRISDYYGSEQTSIEALNYLSPKKGKRHLLSLYNNLGIVSNELGQYEDARYWYNQARSLITNQKQLFTLENNIGIVYRNEKEYQKATMQFQKVVSSEIINESPLIYAMSLDNLGYVKFLNGEKQVTTELYSAYKLRKDGKSFSGQIVSELHLGEYHLKIIIKIVLIFI